LSDLPKRKIKSEAEKTLKIEIDDEAFDFNQQLSAVKKTSKWGFIDKANQIQIEFFRCYLQVTVNPRRF